MEQVTHTMEPVVRLEDPGPDADAVLELKGGTRCTLGRQDPRFAVWQRIIESGRASGMPVYVERTAGGAVRSLLPVAARKITALGEPTSDDRIPVSVAVSPAKHYLAVTRDDHAELRGLLEHAAQTRQALFLAVEPRTLEIVAARRPPEGLKYVVI